MSRLKMCHRAVLRHHFTTTGLRIPFRLATARVTAGAFLPKIPLKVPTHERVHERVNARVRVGEKVCEDLDAVHEIGFRKVGIEAEP